MSVESPQASHSIFNVEYSEIGCEVAEDFWKFFMSSESQFKDDSADTQSSDFDSLPGSPCNNYLASPERSQDENYHHDDLCDSNRSHIKEEPYDRDRFNSLEDSQTQELLSLSREDLLKLSSKGLEEYAQSLAATRPLTVEEEKLLKRQRRLIKNRESAQLSRQRKKIYIEDLERQVSTLTAENVNLSKKLSSLSVNNHNLVEEVMQLQSAIKNTPGSSCLSKKKQYQGEQNLRAAGVCLMLVLFSCGLFLNLSNPPKKISLFQNPCSAAHPALSSEKLSVMETRDLIKNGNQNNQPEQEESSKSSTKKNKNHKRTREDEALDQVKRQCLESQILCQETFNNQASVEFYGQDCESSKDSIVTVILPTEEVGSPSKPDIPSPSHHVEFFPVFVSDQESTDHSLMREVEVD